MPVASYRKKPVVVDAVQLKDDNSQEVLHWVKENGGSANVLHWEDGRFLIDTLEGRMAAAPGDFIIKGVKGEFYPCKPDIFEATYEAVK